MRYSSGIANAVVDIDTCWTVACAAVTTCATAGSCAGKSVLSIVIAVAKVIRTPTAFTPLPAVISACTTCAGSIISAGTCACATGNIA